MKRILLLLVIPTVAWADHPAVAVQGGRLAEVHGHRLEFVTRGETVELLLTDEHNRPIAAEGWSGKAAMLAAGAKATVALAPAGGNKLAGKAPVGAELAAAVVNVVQGDHAMSVRFPALQPAEPPAAALAARGGTVYRDICAACHGERLEGQAGWQTPAAKVEDKKAPPLDPTGHAWHHSDDDLAQSIRQGSAPMPGYAGTLPEEDIRALVAYMKSTWPAATLAQQPKTAAVKKASMAPAGHSAHHHH